MRSDDREGFLSADDRCAPPAYKVEDRSILLPHYRRIFVEPILPLLPRRLTPNAITHAGHALNLFGVVLLIALWPQRGWPFAASAMFIQLWTLCDNVDGAHARRTGQSSPYGEFLDHGLDILNVTYVGLVTGLALGVSAGWWVTLALLVPGAVAVTYWEQAETGVLRLGLLNQIESAAVLSATLVSSALLGNDWTHRAAFAGISLEIVFLLWLAGQIGVGAVRAIVRVGRATPRALPALLSLFACYGALVFAWRVGVITTISAVTIGVAVNLFYCVRMMSLRLEAKKPHVGVELVVTTMALAACAALRAATHIAAFDALANIGLTATSCAILGGRVVLETRDDIQRLACPSGATRNAPAAVLESVLGDE